MFKGSSAATPEEYLEGLEEPRKGEMVELHNLIRKNAPGLTPHMQSGMLAYGTYHYKGKSSEGEWMPIALASRKNYISLYVVATEEEQYITEQFKSRLPKTTIGKSCVSFKRLADVDQAVLSELIAKGSTFGQ